jgi:hypothetical protein
LAPIELQCQPRLSASFYFGPWSLIYVIWSLINHLTFNSLEFHPWFQSIRSYSSTPFRKWFLTENFFNLDLNWTQNFLAFLVNGTWFKSNISDPFTLQHRDYVPAELGWTMSWNDDDPVNCRGYYNRSFGSECECGWGYEGSPYLGCIGKYFFPPKIWVMTAFNLFVEKMMILLWEWWLANFVSDFCPNIG